MTASPEILDLVHRWADAEQGNDPGLLDGLLTDDFVGVGPVGFVITRDVWLGRFERGLDNHAFRVADPQVRDYGNAAVVVGVLDQETLVKGTDSSGRFRVTLVAVRPGESWLIANVHLGPLQFPGRSGG